MKKYRLILIFLLAFVIAELSNSFINKTTFAEDNFYVIAVPKAHNEIGANDIGWEIVQNVCGMGSSTDCIATCPDLKKVIGGGCEGPFGPKVSTPYNSGTEWLCRWDDTVATHIAYAICINP